ncbi:MAG: hypothetical protein AB7U18_24465, partial [Dehalococcoidia bacterium]
HMPELAPLIEEVESTGKPRRITRDDHDVAVLVPVRTRRRRGAPPRVIGRSITEETAGIFKDYRLARPLSPQEERNAFEEGVAQEVNEHAG